MDAIQMVSAAIVIILAVVLTVLLGARWLEPAELNERTRSSARPRPAPPRRHSPSSRFPAATGPRAGAPAEHPAPVTRPGAPGGSPPQAARRLTPTPGGTARGAEIVIIKDPARGAMVAELWSQDRMFAGLWRVGDRFQIEPHGTPPGLRWVFSADELVGLFEAAKRELVSRAVPQPSTPSAPFRT